MSWTASLTFQAGIKQQRKKKHSLITIYLHQYGTIFDAIKKFECLNIDDDFYYEKEHYSYCWNVGTN